ncbi:hypothetical protein [Nocardia testacea]|uniref:hypothetical protein n=1 Tax=Nocardia testacea TaxID=248551 RepID=UPI0033DACA0C
MSAHTPTETVVAGALHAAGLPADRTELAGMVARYPRLRAAVDALYSLPGVHAAVPLPGPLSDGRPGAEK